VGYQTIGKPFWTQKAKIKKKITKMSTPSTLRLIYRLIALTSGLVCSVTEGSNLEQSRSLAGSSITTYLAPRYQRLSINTEHIELSRNSVIVGQGGGGALIYNLQDNTVDKSMEAWKNTAATAIALSPNGKYLAIGQQTGNIDLWNMETKTLLAGLDSHYRPISALAWAPDGSKMISAGVDYKIKIWNVETREVAVTINASSYIASLLVTSDGSRVISGSSQGKIKIWSISTGELLQTLTGHTDELTSLILSSDQEILLSSSFDRTIKIWNITTGEVIKTLTDHSESVLSLAFSPDETQFVSVGKDLRIRVWAMETLSILKTLETPKEPSAAKFNSNTFIIYGDRSGNLYSWDTNGTVIDKKYTSHRGRFYSLTLNPDQTRIFVGGESGISRVYNLSDGSLFLDVDNHHEFITAVAMDSSNSFFITAGADDLVRTWNTTLAEQKTLPIEAVSAAATNPSDTLFATGDLDGKIILRDMYTTNNPITLTGHTDRIYALHFTADNTTLISSSSDKTIRLWNLQTHTISHTLTEADGTIYDFTITSDNKDLFATCRDGKVLHYTLSPTVKHIKTYQPTTDTLYAITVSTDKTHLILTNVKSKIMIFDVQKAKIVHEVDHNVATLRYIGDGGKVVSAGWHDWTVWDDCRNDDQDDGCDRGCGAGQVWNPSLEKCAESCPVGLMGYRGRCISGCPYGKKLNEARDGCVVDDTPVEEEERDETNPPEPEEEDETNTPDPEEEKDEGEEENGPKPDPNNDNQSDGDSNTVFGFVILAVTLVLLF